MKLRKPEAVPMTEIGNQSDKSEGAMHHIMEKNMINVKKAIVE
jgi:hypothetical protein